MSDNLPMNASLLDGDEIVSIEYLCENENTVKMVIQMEYPYFNVRLHCNGAVYYDCFNDKEPYDRMTHIFRLPLTEVNSMTEIFLFLSDDETDGDLYCYKMIFGNITFADINNLMVQNDSKIIPQNQTTEEIFDGVQYTHMHCTDRDNAPVEVFVIEADMRKVSLYVGTPNDGLEACNCKAKIPDMIASAEINSVNVIASVNGDFFDMFGDGSPSGLCVKNGKIIANENCMRPFVGQLKNGKAVITSLKEGEAIKGDLQYAVAGLQWILKDGEPYEWAPLEPFGYTRHPRTCVGIKPNGNVVLLEVDGRIPDYSNGATLFDLACLLKSFGCISGINIDGGGSSAVYTKIYNSWILQSNPADLVRPNDKLIREEYNCIMVVEK